MKITKHEEVSIIMDDIEAKIVFNTEDNVAGSNSLGTGNETINGNRSIGRRQNSWMRDFKAISGSV